MLKKTANFSWYQWMIVCCLCLYSLFCLKNFFASYVSAYLTARAELEDTVVKESRSGVLVDESSEDIDVQAKSEDVLPENRKSQNALYSNYLKLVEKTDNRNEYFDSLWQDGLCQKTLLCQADNYYSLFFTGEVASSQVLKGKENWLFYKSVSDGNPIGDYDGSKSFSEDELSAMLQAALDTQADLTAQGIKFSILVAPNKENVYADKMPEKYAHAENSRTDILVDYLAENGVNIISPKQDLVDASGDYQLYYKYDTHWNQLGAYIGTRKVLETWEFELPSLNEESIDSYPLKEGYHFCGYDDLALMVGLRESVFNDELEYEVSDTKPVDWDGLEENFTEEKGTAFHNPDAQSEGTLLLVGDSFRTSMLPLLLETFTDVYVIHRAHYSSELLEEINPDYLIAEYVERYSDQIEEIGMLID